MFLNEQRDLLGVANTAASVKRKEYEIRDIYSTIDVNYLTKEADSLVEQAEAQGSMELVIKCNAIRKAAVEKMELLEKLQGDIRSRKQRLA